MANILYGVSMSPKDRNFSGVSLPKKSKEFFLKCSRCGKKVSSVPFVREPIIRAWIECPECIQKETQSKLND
jgi:DNA-directed RNA polymerase subunit RPC12/RpoP